MSLKELVLQKHYRTGENDILEDFFKPCLKNSNRYFRSAGFFSSSALEAFGEPLGNFLKNEGQMKLLTSVNLEEVDYDAIRTGLNQKDVVLKKLDQIIDKEFREGIGDGASRLVALLELNRLEIKIAVPKNGVGIFHEKIGIFMDEEENLVAFSGSINESKAGFQKNFESFDVFTSWTDSEKSRIDDKQRYFERLWENNDSGATVYEISDAIRKKLITIRNNFRGNLNGSSEASKWRHQQEAVEKFLIEKKGVLNFATGTGKTRIALTIIRRLVASGDIRTIIISTDGNDLLGQWSKQIYSIRNDMTPKPIIHRHFGEFKEVDQFLSNPENKILLCSRYITARALNCLSGEQPNRTLLIHDEVHGLGSTEHRNKLGGLSDKVNYRLGLSATPERKYDEEGNKFIEEHIGPIIMEFSLFDAIQRGILSPFSYYPLDFEITEEDKQKLSRIYAKVELRKKEGNPMTKEEVWRDISNVYKLSEAKLPIFAEFIGKHVNFLERCIIFVQEAEYGRKVLDIVQKYRNDFHTYFSGDDKDILSSFALGNIQCLISCHRLSEGIDIQSLKNVILFSSDKSRLETIQRIGRCLRLNSEDPKKIANIVDFIRVTEKGENPDNDRKQWLIDLSNIRPTGE
jgi:superfamily II DNA or RNA helicase